MLTKCRIFAIFTVLLVLCGCSGNKGTQPGNVHLCNYKNIAITEEMYLVSEADLNTAMTMYAISTDASLEDYTGLTDEIATKYYGYDTVIDLREQALLDIVSHRIVEAVYEQILMNSHMDFHANDSHFERYYSNRMSSIDFLSKQTGTTVALFLEHNYQMTVAEFTESEIDFYVTVCIIKEILDAENQSDLQTDIDSARSSIAQELGCSVDETYKILLDEDLFYSIAESKIHELIIEWYADDITAAYTAAKQAL